MLPSRKSEGSATAVLYSYSSLPRVLPVRSPHTSLADTSKTEQGPVRYANLMFDRRVVRGITCARPGTLAAAQPSPLEVQRKKEELKRALARRRAKERMRPKTPEPVEGREHVNVQTELYLEEISDRIIEVDNECQTDEFLDRPPTPLFIPAKTGRDVATQIEEGELFDFDIEVKPIMEVLIGKTVEQALLEVAEEEELAQLWARQRAYAELRNAELAEVQRLEEQDRRYREEKKRRKLQHKQLLQKQKEVKEKIAAQAFARCYLADLIPSTFNSLRERGYFYDPVERDIETEFLPWLMEEVEETLQKKVLARTMLDWLIHDVVQTRSDMFTLKPLPARTEETAKEPMPTPPMAAGTKIADQQVPEKEETDHRVAEE
ncbi:RSPH3 protein, partial [Rhinopomastus cyanomelas]|nr:RSPH3 protein [Rhinopomastus cyanomelas]